VLRGGQSINFAVPVELAAALLDAQKQRQQPAVIPLRALASATGVDKDVAERSAMFSSEFVQVETARLEANAAAAGNAIGRYQQADWGNVLNAAKALVAKYTDSSSAYRELGQVYEDMGFSDEAIESYQRGVTLDPQRVAVGCSA
jgi:tetratricopeptide (TPR) repeat protein